MEVTIKKWGNCAAVRLPVSVLRAASLSIDQPLTVTAEDGSIVLRPIRKKTSAQLIAETPSFAGVEGWNELAPVGLETEAFR